jgi:ABC-type sugar transport system permease subunit
MKMMKKTKTFSLERKRARYGYLFTLPLILGLAFIFIPNIVQTVLYSLNETVIDGSGYTLEWIGLKYYIKAFAGDAKFLQYMLSSLGELLVQVPVILIFSLFMAMVLNQKFKGRVVARAIFFLPLVLSTGIISRVEASTQLDSLMSMRDALEGMQGTRFDLSQLLLSMNFNATLSDIVVSAATGIKDIVNASGMQIFIFLAAFQQIPVSVYEAAQVEGCSKWVLFWKVVIPMTAKQILVAGVYTVVDVFTRTDGVLFTYIHEMAYTNNQYSYAMAMYLVYAMGLGIMMAIALATAYKLMNRSEGGKRRAKGEG